jgi:hypothetical protein
MCARNLQESGADFVDRRQEILLVCFISLCYVRVVVDRIEEARVLRGKREAGNGVSRSRRPREGGRPGRASEGTNGKKKKKKKKK